MVSGGLKNRALTFDPIQSLAQSLGKMAFMVFIQQAKFWYTVNKLMEKVKI